MISSRRRNLHPTNDQLVEHGSFRKNIFHTKSDIPLLYKNLLSLRRRDNIGRTTIRKLIQDNFDQHPIFVERMEVKSTFHKLFKVRTKTKKYLVKINICDLFVDTSFYTDLFMQNKLKGMKLPSAMIYQIDISRKKYNFDYMVMEYIEGKTLESRTQALGKLYFSLGQILRKIHSIETRFAGTIEMKMMSGKNTISGASKTWSIFFTRNLQRHIHKVAEIGAISKGEEKKITNLFEENKKSIECTDLSLIHNDLSARNIIVRSNKIVGIIDWEDAIVGDPTWELAFIHTFLFREEDVAKFEDFCKGYSIEISHLFSLTKYWLYYLRIALIKTISRYSSGSYNQQGLQIDKLRIRNALRNL